MEGFDCKVADISLADWGRKEIQLAEVEMPGNLSITPFHLFIPFLL
jgi:hypothetical protein